jgi:hypothetical protein
LSGLRPSITQDDVEAFPKAKGLVLHSVSARAMQTYRTNKAIKIMIGIGIPNIHNRMDRMMMSLVS